MSSSGASLGTFINPIESTYFSGSIILYQYELFWRVSPHMETINLLRFYRTFGDDETTKFLVIWILI